MSQPAIGMMINVLTSCRYNDVIKQGDALITKLQKYGQVVRLRGSERS